MVSTTSKAALTQKRLKELLKYDPETGNFTWIQHTIKSRNGSSAGWINGRGYIQIYVDRNLYASHRLIWFYMTGSWPEKYIDHKNRVRHDNSWCNLREATGAENQRNRSTGSNNTSGYKGVYWHKGNKKWIAKINLNGARAYLGSYKDIIDAHKAYKRAAIEHYGEFASNG